MKQRHHRPASSHIDAMAADFSRTDALHGLQKRGGVVVGAGVTPG